MPLKPILEYRSPILRILGEEITISLEAEIPILRLLSLFGRIAPDEVIRRIAAIVAHTKDSGPHTGIQTPAGRFHRDGSCLELAPGETGSPWHLAHELYSLLHLVDEVVRPLGSRILLSSCFTSGVGSIHINVSGLPLLTTRTRTRAVLAVAGILWFANPSLMPLRRSQRSNLIRSTFSDRTLFRPLVTSHRRVTAHSLPMEIERCLPVEIRHMNTYLDHQVFADLCAPCQLGKWLCWYLITLKLILETDLDIDDALGDPLPYLDAHNRICLDSEGLLTAPSEIVELHKKISAAARKFAGRDDAQLPAWFVDYCEQYFAEARASSTARLQRFNDSATRKIHVLSEVLRRQFGYLRLAEYEEIAEELHFDALRPSSTSLLEELAGVERVAPGVKILFDPNLLARAGALAKHHALAIRLAALGLRLDSFGDPLHSAINICPFSQGAVQEWAHLGPPQEVATRAVLRARLIRELHAREARGEIQDVSAYYDGIAYCESDGRKMFVPTPNYPEGGGPANPHPIEYGKNGTEKNAEDDVVCF